MNARLFNFSPGPSMLPEEVIEGISENLHSFQSLALSPMELGHRTKQYEDLSQETHDLLRIILNVPDSHEIISMHGGARTQFAAVPMNLANQKQTTLYIKSGHWSALAFEEAKKFSNAILHKTLKPDYTWQEENSINPDAKYLHYTPNETVHGILIPTPDTNIELVADATSTLLGIEMDIAKHGIIYASAQKNIGIAGITFVIIKKSLIPENNRMNQIPSIMCYANQVQSKSLYNTPATFSLFVTNLVLKWLQRQGGVEVIIKRNKLRSQRLYAALEASKHYVDLVPKELRSPLNVTFNLANNALLSKFLAEAHAAGLYALKGHSALGGIRASIYNGMPDNGVDKLIEFLHEFANKESI